MSAEIIPPRDERTAALKAALFSIAERNEGRLDPADVVAEARSETSPLHTLFTWDDDTAAERFRLLQAGALIRRIKITIMRTEPTTKKVRIEHVREFESIDGERTRGKEPPKGGSYIRAAKIAKNPKMRAAMVATVTAELKAIRQRYDRLTEMRSIWAEIDRLMG